MKKNWSVDMKKITAAKKITCRSCKKQKREETGVEDYDGSGNADVGTF